MLYLNHFVETDGFHVGETWALSMKPAGEPKNFCKVAESVPFGGVCDIVTVPTENVGTRVFKILEACEIRDRANKHLGCRVLLQTKEGFTSWYDTRGIKCREFMKAHR